MIDPKKLEQKHEIISILFQIEDIDISWLRLNSINARETGILYCSILNVNSIKKLKISLIVIFSYLISKETLAKRIFPKISFSFFLI